MASIRNPLNPLTKRIRFSSVIAIVAILCVSWDAHAQVRTKKPDRGVYRPPTLDAVPREDDAVPREEAVPSAEGTESEPLAKLIRAKGDVELRTAPQRNRADRPAADSGRAKWGAPLVDAELSDAPSAKSGNQPRRQQPPRTTAASPLAQPPATQRSDTQRSDTQRSDTQRSDTVRSFNTDPIQVAPPHRAQQVGNQVVITGGETWVEEGEVYYEPAPYGHVMEPSCGGCSGCGGCDVGCDSIGYHNVNNWCDHANAHLSLAPDRWFGSAELMLMFRKGDFLPPLVTTGDSTRTEIQNQQVVVVSNEDQAGELGRDDTRIVAGSTNVFDDLTAGGRFTIGTWLDGQRCRSLVLRGWFAGEQRYRVFANQDAFPVLARPFLNVSDDQDPEPDALLIAFPEVEITDPNDPPNTTTVPARATGSVSVLGDSNVYGADLSVRQLWYGRFGGTIDVLYGYQYMGLRERLAIGSSSTSLDEDFAPVGTVLTVTDAFDVHNDFHGGQIGLASSYREHCWSFRGLVKIGFGGLQRRAKLRGVNTRSIDGETDVDPAGLLVRSTNIGNYSDTAFAWSPELDLTLGWQYFSNFDVTFGYHLVALTDALQVSGTIDPDLAVNLSEPPEQAQRPAANFRYDTFYLQGIHFGLQYVY